RANRHTRGAARPRPPARGLSFQPAVPEGVDAVLRGRAQVVRRARREVALSPACERVRAVTVTTLLEAKGLPRHFKAGGTFAREHLHAVDDASFVINHGEIVALAGESGSGKSTIARLIARVYKPTSGELYYRGRPLSSYRSRRDVLEYRGAVPMVFQDSFS